MSFTFFGVSVIIQVPTYMFSIYLALSLYLSISHLSSTSLPVGSVL